MKPGLSILFAAIIIVSAPYISDADKPIKPNGVTSVENHYTMHSSGHILPETMKKDSVTRTIDAEGTEIDGKSVESGWELIDSLSTEIFIPPGKTAGILLISPDIKSDFYIELFSDLTALSMISEEAVNKAPKWLRPLLRYRLSTLSESDADRWAGIINSVDDPIVDETAFSIATLSSEYLSSDLANPDLMISNALYMYAADSILDYVEIVDYGTSTDDDYYSTVRYRKINADSVSVEVEVPRDIYYWYIVHPKLTDEIPAFIDPDIVEKKPKHDDNIADPPVGVFWRDFLLNNADTDYPLLKDMLSACTGVWNYADKTDHNMALRQISDWVVQSLDFDSDSERPHQPVRIYRKHKGRCGEHQDISAAAARAALIPAVGVSSISTDHAWNEFWDERWVQWEPVGDSFDDPLHYEHDWGKVFASVIRWRSDGIWQSVTERYSDGLATITIKVVDQDSLPVDGADITLYIPGGIFGYTYDNHGQTGNNGEYTFTVGEANDFAVRVDSGIGSYPEDPHEVLDIVENSEDGAAYFFTIMINASMPERKFKPVSAPQDTTVDFRVEFSYSVTYEEDRGFLLFDDIGDAEETISYGLEETSNGEIDFYIADSTQAAACMADTSFESFFVAPSASAVDTTIDMVSDKNYALFLNNDTKQGNPQFVLFSARLFKYTESGVHGSDKDGILPIITKIGRNYPNPFNPVTTIPFSLSKPGNVRLSVWDVSGKLIIVLEDKYLSAGNHTVQWNGTNLYGNQVSSGVYILKLSTGKKDYISRILLLK